MPQLYEGCSPDLLRSPVNAIRLTLHPQGMGPRIVNFIEWRAHTITMLRQQVGARADPVIQALLTEVMSYPAPPSAMALATSDGPQRYATPLQIATPLGTISFLNTLTIFGTPQSRLPTSCQLGYLIRPRVDDKMARSRRRRR